MTRCCISAASTGGSLLSTDAPDVTPQRSVCDVGGVELAVTRRPGGAPPVVYLHGWTGACDDFTAVADMLAPRRGVVTWDHRGHGTSGHAGPYTVAQLVADAAVVLDRTVDGPAVVVGHSMGGVVAQQLVLGSPERVAALVLVGTFGSHVPLSGPLAQVAEAACEMALTQGMEAVAAAQQAIGAPQTDADAQRLLRTDPEAFAGLMRDMRAASDRLDALGGVTVPTLVVCGTDDVGLRGPSKRLAEAIPGARLHWFDGAGHSPHVDDPARFAALVGDFVASVDDDSA